MIKLAESLFDVADAISLVQSFLNETSYSQGALAASNREHLGLLVYRIKQHGYIWLAYVDNQPVGILMAVKEANMWIPSIIQMREMVWYVKPEYRNSSIGGRLFVAYTLQGEKLCKESVIQGYFTTRMSTTNSIDLERRGFRRTEETYLKEH